MKITERRRMGHLHARCHTPGCPCRFTVWPVRFRAPSGRTATRYVSRRWIGGLMVGQLSLPFAGRTADA